MGKSETQNKIANHKVDDLYAMWQECQLWNQTFDEKLSEVDVAEIRQLIDESNENKNHSIESRDTFK